MDRLPPLRLLLTFDAVARRRSMQLAAEELNVTPPAITQAIRALEAHIGVALMDRSTKPARLNAAGERLSQATRNGLGLIGETIGELRFMAGLAGSQIVVSCTIGMANYWLMPRLPKFYEQNEGITVNVQAPPTDLPTLSGGIDLALRYGRGGWRDGETHKLFDEIACPVGRPDLIARLEADPAGLRHAPLIHVRSSHQWAGWPDYAAARNLPRPGAPVQVFDNYVNAVQAAIQGRGILLGWKSITAGLVADGTLAELPGGQVDFGTSYYLTVAEASRSKTAVADFARWLRQMVGQGGAA